MGLMGNQLRIVYTADENYAMPLATSLRSVADNTSDLQNVAVTILTTSFAEDALRRVEKSCPEITPEVVIVPESVLAGLPVLKYWSALPYLRLMAASLIPGDEPLLLLDADTVVLADLWELWRTPLGDKPLAAVRDPIRPQFGMDGDAERWTEMGVTATTPYFNAGAVIVNPELYRDLCVMEDTLAYLRKYADDIIAGEEEALNVVLRGNWQPLEPGWNIFTIVAGALVVARRLGLPYSVSAEYEQAMRKPKIVHFAGKDKPWFASRGPFSSVFYQYLDRTDWSGWRPETHGEGITEGAN